MSTGGAADNNDGDGSSTDEPPTMKTPPKTSAEPSAQSGGSAAEPSAASPEVDRRESLWMTMGIHRPDAGSIRKRRASKNRSDAAEPNDITVNQQSLEDLGKSLALVGLPTCNFSTLLKFSPWRTSDVPAEGTRRSSGSLHGNGRTFAFWRRGGMARDGTLGEIRRRRRGGRQSLVQTARRHALPTRSVPAKVEFANVYSYLMA